MAFKSYYKFFITYYYIMSRLILIQNALPAPSVLGWEPHSNHLVFT